LPAAPGGGGAASAAAAAAQPRPRSLETSVASSRVRRPSPASDVVRILYRRGERVYNTSKSSALDWAAKWASQKEEGDTARQPTGRAKGESAARPPDIAAIHSRRAVPRSLLHVPDKLMQS